MAPDSDHRVDHETHGHGSPARLDHPAHTYAAAPSSPPAGAHGSHHAHMVADFRRRFWVSLVLTIPVLALARHIQGWLGLHGVLTFPGDGLVQFVLASAIFF